MKISVRPYRAFMSWSRLRIWACTDTSSAETGSSQMISFGSVATARAIEMRWHWPPENSCGRFGPAVSGSMPTVSSTSRTFAVAALVVADLPDVETLADDVVDPAGAGSATRSGPGRSSAAWAGSGAASSPCSAVRSLPSNCTCPLVGWTSCMTARPVVLLPQPDSPTSPRVSPVLHVEADVRDRVDLQARRARPGTRRRGPRCAAASRRRAGGGRFRCRPRQTLPIIAIADVTPACWFASSAARFSGVPTGNQHRNSWPGRLGVEQRRLLLDALVLHVRAARRELAARRRRRRGRAAGP